LMRMSFPSPAAGQGERANFPTVVDYLISGSSVSAVMRIWSV